MLRRKVIIMGSLDSALTRQAYAKGIGVNVGTDGPVAIRIWKTGSESATSVTVTTATNIVLVGSTTTDTVTFATYTTIGAVADQINTTGRWSCVVLDALRSQASASTLVDGAITSGTDELGNTVYDALTDTSVYKSFVAALSPFRNRDAVKGHRVHLQEANYLITLGGAGAGNVRVYRRSAKGTETEVWREASVSATATVVGNFATGTFKLTSENDGDILVRVLDGTSIADAAANRLRVVGILE